MTQAQAEMTFLGGAKEIGASCALFKVGDTRLLVDCGVRFGSQNALPNLAMLEGQPLDAIVVTHAHTDHTGGLPVVCDAFANVPVYATPPTIDITMILLRDALKIMSSNDREAEIPLYAEKQVARVNDAFVPIHHGKQVIINDVAITFLPEGHILGASMVHLDTPAGNFMFTGDYSVSAQLTVPALESPALHTDMVITEATYGNRFHEDRNTAEQQLITRIKKVLENNGRALIPSFAVGRAQEILLLLKRAIRNGNLPPIPVYVDGMVRSVCDVYGRNEKYVSRALYHEIKKASHPFYTNGIMPVARPDDRKAVLENGPCVIVASSGMLSGGASVQYAKHMIQQANDAILITGYQDEESPGKALLDLTEQKKENREIRIDGQTTPVKCQFEKYGLSAHADRMQILGVIEGLRPRSVAFVHGDLEAIQSLSGGCSAKDKIEVQNGQTICLGYPKRRSFFAKVNKRREIDKASARALLGPPTDRPIHAAAVAEAWFGRKVDSLTMDAFIGKLEDFGLVKRDDVRRRLLHVLAPSQSNAFPAEAALEESLKRENPKGKLLEFCMRAAVAPPECTTSEEGAFYTATMCMRFRNKPFQSGIQRAASKRVAEQLAAEVLRRQIRQELQGSETVIAVSDDQANALKHSNPKGRLVEWCAAHRLEAPSYHIMADIDGFRVKAAIRQGENQTIETHWFGHATQKTAEQAAAAELGTQLDQVQIQENAAKTAAGAAPAPQRCEGATADRQETYVPTRDPMMLLNEMRQLGLLTDFGYSVTGIAGPAHQPQFEIIGYAILEDGEKIETNPVIAPAKKAGRKEAANRIVEILREKGLLASKE
ncbi:MAG: MBL fold metallo-hydrolase [Deltaproteobacteria bacterium]|nr:MBL fold metallo-hydrolase [Deltaproteobacteria bacterium]